MLELICYVSSFSRKIRLSWEDEQTQVALGLDKLMPIPRIATSSFNAETGAFTIYFGREGTRLSNSDAVLALGIQMRMTKTAKSVGIQLAGDFEPTPCAMSRRDDGGFDIYLNRDMYKQPVGQLAIC